MGAKKIIIPIAIVAVVACGVGYYCYNTVNANTLSEGVTSSSNTLGLGSSTTSSSGTSTTDANSSNASTKVTSSNNETSDGNTTNINSTNTYNQSSTANGGTNKTTSNNATKVISRSTNVENTSSNSAKITQTTSGKKLDSTSSTDTTNNVNGTTSNIGTSSSTSQTLSQLKEASLNQLSQINDAVNEINNKTKDENPTQYEVNNAEGNIYQLWEQEVNTIYSQLQEALPSNEFSKLQQEQESWINSTNTSATNYAKSYAGGGSDYLAVLYMKLGEYYKARCYYLVDNYM